VGGAGRGDSRRSKTMGGRRC
jgi:hypothetical protein